MTQADFLELRWLLHNRINEEKRERYVVQVQASCAGKQAFLTPADARRAMRSESTRRSCVEYHCPHCKRWHVGSRKSA